MSTTTYQIFDAATLNWLGEVKGTDGPLTNNATALGIDFSRLPALNMAGIEILHDNETLGIGGFGLSDGSHDPDRGGFADRYIVIQKKYLKTSMRWKLTAKA